MRCRTRKDHFRPEVAGQRGNLRGRKRPLTASSRFGLKELQWEASKLRISACRPAGSIVPLLVATVMSCWLAHPSLVSAQTGEGIVARALFEEVFLERAPTHDDERLLVARAFWEREAADGDSESQYRLSFLYWFGFGGVERDQVQAMWLAVVAAAGGYAPAQFAVASFYERGDGQLDRNLRNAVEWYKRAAAQGHVLARDRLYRAYSNGEIGLSKDDEQARFWR